MFQSISKFQTTLRVNKKIYFKFQGNPSAIVNSLNAKAAIM